ESPAAHRTFEQLRPFSRADDKRADPIPLLEIRIAVFRRPSIRCNEIGMFTGAVRADLATELQVTVQFHAPGLRIAPAGAPPVVHVGRHPARPSIAAITQAFQPLRLQTLLTEQS